MSDKNYPNDGQMDNKLRPILADMSEQEKEVTQNILDQMNHFEDANVLTNSDKDALFDRIEASMDSTDTNSNLKLVSLPSEHSTLPENDSTHQPAPRTRRKPWMQAFRPEFASVAASIVVVLALGVLFLSRPRTFVAERGAQESFTLPDGSLVTLNSDSQISYWSGVFWNRSIQLEGEGFFDVTPGEEQFSVETTDAVVTVLGTKFNVRSRSDTGSRRTQVTVDEGRVGFRSVEHSQGVILTAGQRSSLIEGALRPSTVESFNEDAPFEWMNGDLIFRNVPLESAVAEASRRLGVEILLSAPSRADTDITVSFRAPLTMEVVLQGLSAPLGLQYRESQSGFEIYHSTVELIPDDADTENEEVGDIE